MRRFVLGIALCVAFHLPVNASDLSGSKDAQLKHVGKRLVCAWVPTDRTLKPLLGHTAVPSARRITATPDVKASSTAVVRADPAYISRQPSLQTALMVGVAY